MSIAAHRRVEELMARAESLEATDPQTASELYLEAADQEAEVFKEIPVSRPRTRGIIAVSVVSLLRQAGAKDDAARQAHEYLAGSKLPGFARAQLAKLIADIEADVQSQPAVEPMTSHRREEPHQGLLNKRSRSLLKGVLVGYFTARDRLKRLVADAFEQLHDLYEEAQAEYASELSTNDEVKRRRPRTKRSSAGRRRVAALRTETRNTGERSS